MDGPSHSASHETIEFFRFKLCLKFFKFAKLLYFDTSIGKNKIVMQVVISTSIFFHTGVYFHIDTDT